VPGEDRQHVLQQVGAETVTSSSASAGLRNANCSPQNRADVGIRTVLLTGPEPAQAPPGQLAAESPATFVVPSRFLPPRAGTRTGRSPWLPATNEGIHPCCGPGRFWCYLPPPFRRR
jgi:hypothetical protein